MGLKLFNLINLFFKGEFWYLSVINWGDIFFRWFEYCKYDFVDNGKSVILLMKVLFENGVN